MANNCCYDMKVVGKTKESVERLLSIMQYKDTEFYMYRVFSAESGLDAEQDGDLWVLSICGDVAWSCKEWVHGVRGKDYPCAENGSKFANLQEICRALDIGVEIWSDEPGMGFEEHYIIDHNGTVVVDECEEYMLVEDEDGELKEDSDGNWVKDGGFKEFMDWAFANEIYGLE